MKGAVGSLHFAVIVDTSDAERVREALRASLGLTVRGDAVTVIATPRAGTAIASIASTDSLTQRCVATLTTLGHRILAADELELEQLVRSCDAVEVWT